MAFNAALVAGYRVSMARVVARSVRRPRVRHDLASLVQRSSPTLGRLFLEGGRGAGGRANGERKEKRDDNTFLPYEVHLRTTTTSFIFFRPALMR